MRQYNFCPKCSKSLNAQEMQLGFCQNCKHDWKDEDDFENEDDSVAFDCDKKELKAMRDMIDSSIYKVNSEAEELKEVEQKTVATLETLGAFADWVKGNHEIEIPDDIIVEYLEQD